MSIIKKVLIIDENMAFAAELAKKLESMNIEATITNDPKAAAVLINELGSDYHKILDADDVIREFKMFQTDVH